jgi:hypothetical protein
MDTKFGRYAELDWTQHMFKFEPTDESEERPLGVKTSYKKYAQDVCTEIRYVPDRQDADIPYKLYKFICQWEVLPSSILKFAPENTIEPEVFVADSRSKFEQVSVLLLLRL